MSSKKHRLARQAAYHEALKQRVWNKGETEVFAKWWRRLLAWVFPKTRKRYADMIGRWYKRVLKSWAKRAYELDHDRDMKAFIAARRKLARIARREQMAKAGVAR
jgi:hypothetical protein